MTVAETAKIMEYLKQGCPNGTKQLDEKKAVMVWADQFADEEYALVAAAARAYVATNTSGFFPVPAQIKAEITKARMADMPEPYEVWNHIRKAISNSGYHAGEEFDLLSPIEQRLVGSPRQLYEWGQMDIDRLDSVVASNIQKNYRELVSKESYRMALPTSVSNRLKELVSKTYKLIEG